MGVTKSVVQLSKSIPLDHKWDGEDDDDDVGGDYVKSFFAGFAKLQQE
jgi:hypothetical protein